MRRLLCVAVVVLCAGGVVAYQATQTGTGAGDARVFVPSPQFFLDFSPSFRTSIADYYYLSMVQYYGDHIEGDGQAGLAAPDGRPRDDAEPAVQARLPLRRLRAHRCRARGRGLRDAQARLRGATPATSAFPL